MLEKSFMESSIKVVKGKILAGALGLAEESLGTNPLLSEWTSVIECRGLSIN